MRLISCHSGEVIVSRGEKAYTALSRFIGLMGKEELPAGSALLLKPCCQVHTFFMRFGIDVIFLSRDLHVKHVIENMQPWKISKFVRGSYMVVELPGGSLQGRVHVLDKLVCEG